MAAKIETVRIPNPGMSSANKHKVQKKQWNKWPAAARRQFNFVYGSMARQDMVLHPKTAVLPRLQWDTVRWNAAWLSADGVAEHMRWSAKAA